MKLMINSLAVFAMLAGVSHALTGEEILEAMDNNRNHKTVSASAVMEIHIGDEVRTKSMKLEGITEGSKSLVEFTNPEDEGTKYLMLDDKLWIYFPEENDVVKISGHMLKEGMMGSDVSYEDALEADELSDKYTITVSGEETCGGRECYVIQLDAKTKDAPYYKRKMWVEKKTYIAWKEEMFAKSGRLLKESRVLETKKIGQRQFAVKSETVNKLWKKSKTVFTMTDIKLDAKIDKNKFTLRNLQQ